MLNIVFKNLTEKHRKAWVMRYQFCWRLEKIALEMGTSKQAVSKLLQKAPTPGRVEQANAESA